MSTDHLSRDAGHLVHNVEWMLESDFTLERTVWVAMEPLTIEVLDRLLQEIPKSSCVIHLDIEGRAGALPIALASETLSREWEKRYKVLTASSVKDGAVKLSGAMNRDTHDRWKPLITKGFAQSETQVVAQTVRAIGEVLNASILGKVTVEKISIKFVKHALFNALRGHVTLPLAPLKDSLKDRPVVLVSAGPSLNKQLETLKRYQHILTIICVDSVWKLLDAHGIVPDLVFGLDADNVPSWNASTFHPNSLLSVDIGCHPKMFLSSGRAEIVTAHLPQLVNLASEIGFPSGFLPSGGSVSTTIFCLAHYLGGNPLIFLGQDLAYTDGKDHADGYEYAYPEDFQGERAALGFDIEGYYGGKVRTERPFLHYKFWFEDQIANIGHQKIIINSTEGGAKIAGAAPVPFLNVCEELDSVLKDKPKLINLSLEEKLPDLKLRQGNLEDLKSRIINYSKKAEEGIKLLEKFSTKRKEKIFSKVDQINKSLQSDDPTVKYVVDKFAVLQLEGVRSRIAKKDPDSSEDQRISDSVAGYRDIYVHIKESCGIASRGIDELLKLMAKGHDNESSIIEELENIWRF